MELATREAAARLGVSTRRVHGLIASGQLRARSVGGRFLLDEDSVDMLVGRRRRRGVRPLSRRVAWGVAAMADGAAADWLTSSERSRLRARMRTWDQDPDTWIARLRSRTADERRFRAGPDQRAQLLDCELVGRSGAHARTLVTDRLVGEEQTQLWVVDQSALARVVDRFGLLPTTSGNVLIRVADVPGLPAVGTGAGDAYRLIVSADLLDSPDARSRSAGKALLRHVLSGGEPKVDT